MEKKKRAAKLMTTRLVHTQAKVSNWNIVDVHRGNAASFTTNICCKHSPKKAAFFQLYNVYIFFFFPLASVQRFSDQTCLTRSSEADAGHRCGSSERTKGRRLGKLVWREVIARTPRSAPCCDSGGLSEQRRCGTSRRVTATFF